MIKQTRDVVVCRKTPMSMFKFGPIVRAAIAVSLGGLTSCASRPPSTPVQYKQSEFAAHLSEPQAIAPIGREAVLVAERSGKIVYISRSGRVDLGNIEGAGAAIAYIAERGNTEGLKDLVPVPKSGDQFVWCATTKSGDRIRWTVGRLTAAIDTRPSPGMASSIVWQSEPQAWIKGAGPLAAFSGCRLAFEGDDLLVATGANDRHSGSGRVTRLSLDRRHPPVVVSTGHRNPGGIVVKDGNIWEVEYGPTGGDELNLVTAGGNYGWPQVSKGEPQDDGQPQGSGNTARFIPTRAGSIDPIVSWTPSINPAGMTVWNGKIYISELIGSVLEVTTSGKKIVSQRTFLEIGDRVRDVRASRDGTSLWIVTDGPDARLILVAPNTAA